ncbi:MAG TPA: alpha/beta hydrolase-fold protein [Thermoplasmata archaeon]|nr:alpha/beta hydrolase-fold protein [Thermoplasmata archaeon]
MTIWVPTEARTERVFPGPLAGRLELHPFDSEVLRGNPWGDPSRRDLTVYLPPSGQTEGLPLLLYLPGFTGAGWIEANRPSYLASSRVRRLDFLIRSGGAPEAVLVAPDCLTTLGGSQYLNSSATGRYEDYVVQEILPWVAERYRTGPVGVVGTSSGGFGALSLAMYHPDVFRAAASNAGDLYFEYTYTPQFSLAFRALRKEGGPEALLRKVLAQPTSGFSPHHPMIQALELMAYAACYSPVEDEPGRFELPFDLETGAIRPEVWERWLERDPVRMVQTDRFSEALRRVDYVYVDGGTRDEWALDVGARIFAATARRRGIHVDHEEYDGVHGDGVARYDVFLPRVLGALTGRAASAPSGPV